jgi:HEAT repeat protein
MDRLEQALKLIKSHEAEQLLSGFAILQETRDGRAVQPLIGYLLDENNLPTGRRLAARLLGELGDPAALDALHRVARSDTEKLLAQANEEYELDPARLALVVSQACAQLGDHSLAPVANFFAEHQATDEENPELPVLREQAVQALAWVVGDGMIAALRAALNDEGLETRRAAIDALFYLGAVEVVGDLLALSADPALGNHARVRVHDLTGAPLTDDADALRKWWMSHGAALPSGVCLRAGAPIAMAEVVEQLAEPNLRELILQELQVRTGKRFDTAADPAAAARAWLAAEGKRFEPGGLYKSGHRVAFPKN